MQQQLIKISKLKPNNGQIDGLPKNPRKISKDDYETLKKSITDTPEMIDLRELIVYPLDGIFVVIMGNQRLKACKELGYKEMPCKVLSPETTIEKLKEFTIKDNIAAGRDDWASLNADWDLDILASWGLSENDEDKKVEFTVKAKQPKFELIIECENEEDKEQIFDKLIGEGYKVRKTKKA